MQAAEQEQRKILYVIVCASPVARSIFDFIPLAQAAAWDVCVILTPQARKFVDASRLESMTGRPVRSEFKHPEEPDIFPPAHAIVVLPATFNTLNKWALGITDTLAVGLLCEYTGLKVPIVAFPATGEGLGAHPAFARSVRMLRRYGVCVLRKPEQSTSEPLVSEMILETLEQIAKKG